MIKNGVPYDVAFALEDWELISYTVVFGQFENGNKEWDWDSMSFINRG